MYNVAEETEKHHLLGIILAFVALLELLMKP